MMTNQPPTPSPVRAVVCLLSDQPMPNLLPIHHFRPAQVVMVETDAMKTKKTADNFLEALRLGGLNYASPDKHRIYPLGNQASFLDCADSFRRIVQELEVKGKDVIVNLTGGTKVMSIAAYEVFRIWDARFVYIDANTPDQLQEFPQGPQTTLEHKPTCAEFLSAYGFTNHIDEEMDNWPATLDDVARAFVAQAVEGNSPVVVLPGKNDDQRKQLWANLRDGKADLKPGDLKVLPDLVTPLRAFLCDRPLSQVSVDNDGYMTGQPDGFLGDFLTGGWLEVFVAGLLRKHAKALGLWDVHRGVDINPISQTAAGDSGNELDVVFVHNHSLHVIECKSGLAHDPQFETPYKLDSVVNRVRALRTKILFATTDLSVYCQSKNARPQPLDLNSPEPDLAKKVRGRQKSLHCVLLTPYLLGQLARADGDDQQELNLLREVIK
ncbi:MAG: DUF1887 family CARF protein [Candidatus Sumerlaeaceae bacterium]|nr:DUF1887 family CARF protein [Candidatus Sumerlaeaceae bacterium]